MPDYAQFVEAMAKCRQPQATYEALWKLAADTVGVKLFTLMRFDAASGVAERFFSNMPNAYPVSGTKPVNTTDWARQVLEEKQIFVANDIAGIAEVFYDHELIQSLGCASVINVPVVIGGEVAGTINCLHEEGFYTQEKIEAAERLKLPGAACFLLKELDQHMGAA
ncbi:GAF domain-containing protein [Chelativorans xinjiangense]|uniref:GAF domain-containing protein n=1 Tax=Chelativorans xinjiangense TaxID=2681485 RepID=UPI00135AFF69|nr:GAF domain-containing protein [Chelativorans xinjiangense]